MPKKMNYISLFAGIGGFDRGLEKAGMECVGQVERDKDCNRILDRHWSGKERCTDVKDVTKATFIVRPQLVCGGFPCQDVSVAGRRVGLSGERSGLWWEFRRIIADFLPPWVLIENVPGLLSSWTPASDPPSGIPSRDELGRRIVLDETSDFDTVTRGLAELGYGWAMRIFDAQWHGLAQRRERVLIVGCLGNAARAAEVLFERDCLPWDSPPSREAKPDVAPCVRVGTESGSNEHGNKIAIGIGGEDLSYSVNGDGSRFGSGRDSQDSFVVGPLQAHSVEHGHSMTSQQAAESGQLIASALNSGGRGGFRTEPGEHLIAHALTAEGYDASEDGTGRGTPLVVTPFDTTQITSPGNYSAPGTNSPCHPLATGAHAPAIAYMVHGENSCAMTGNGRARVAEPAEVSRSLDTTGGFTVQQGGNVIAYQCGGSNVGPMGAIRSGNGNESGGVPFIASNYTDGQFVESDISAPVTTGTDKTRSAPIIAFEPTVARNGRGGPSEITRALRASEDGGRTDCKPHVAGSFGVRRLTPRECERLQGFPDDWTRWDADGKELADSPRYRMLGNAVPPPMVEWIGKRIVASEKAQEKYWQNVAAGAADGSYLKPGM